MATRCGYVSLKKQVFFKKKKIVKSRQNNSAGMPTVELRNLYISFKKISANNLFLDYSLRRFKFPGAP